MQMRVTKYGEPVLKEKAKEVEVFDKDLEELANNMYETMLAENGLGLAAPQVDVSKRVFVIDMRRRADEDVPVKFTIDGRNVPLDLVMPLVAVNPKVENAGEYLESADEGCLSFPGIYGEVERFYTVKLTYKDLKGSSHEIVCDGLFARCIQHENDHLDGITFVDRLSTKETLKVAAKLKKLKRQTRDFLKENSKAKK